MERFRLKFVSGDTEYLPPLTPQDRDHCSRLDWKRAKINAKTGARVVQGGSICHDGVVDRMADSARTTPVDAGVAPSPPNRPYPSHAWIGESERWNRNI